MIGNVTMGNYFGGALAYIYKIGVNLSEDKKPVQIETNNVVGNIKQMAWQMAEHAQNSRRLLKPVLHISVSFAPEDNLTQAKEVEAVKAFIKYFGVSEEKHQYVIVKHFDSTNSHYHIVANKLNLDNKSLNVDWYKNDALAIADRVEQELNLFHVQGRTRIFDVYKGEYRNVSKAERAKIIESRQSKVFRDKPLNLNEYQNHIRNSIDTISKYATSLDQLKIELAKVNIQATFRTDPANGSFIGAAFRLNDKIRVKGSEVGFSANVINQRLAENKKIAAKSELEVLLSPSVNKDPVKLLDPKDYYYQYVLGRNGEVHILRQEYHQPDSENERLKKLYLGDLLEVNRTERNAPDFNAGTMNSKNWINFKKVPIETGQLQSIQSSNYLEEFKDVFITQENTPDFDDTTIADADKKKKPIIRRKMRR